MGVVDNAFDFLDEGHFRRFMDRLALGQRVLIHYAPEDPSRSVIAPGCNDYRHSHYRALVVSCILLLVPFSLTVYSDPTL